MGHGFSQGRGMEQCTSGKAVRDEAVRCGRSRKHHQGSPVTVGHQALFLLLFSQKESPLRRWLSRNETCRPQRAQAQGSAMMAA
jgi:hypothetical protein